MKLKYGLEHCVVLDEANPLELATEQLTVTRVSANGMARFRAKYSQFLAQIQNSESSNAVKKRFDGGFMTVRNSLP